MKKLGKPKEMKINSGFMALNSRKTSNARPTVVPINSAPSPGRPAVASGSNRGGSSKPKKGTRMY